MDTLWEKSRAFVVGAESYIGKPLCATLASSYAVIGTSSTGRNNFLRLRLETSGEFDYEKICRNDVVFLLAGITKPSICTRDYSQARVVNVIGTKAFISKVLDRDARVIFFSSDVVYGERGEAFDETAECKPVGNYGRMKYEVEREFLGNPLFKTIRLSYVFSFEDEFTKYLMKCAAQNQPAEIFEPFVRAIVYRDDIVQGAVALAGRWNEFPQPVINFGGPEALSRVEFANALRELALQDLRLRVIEPESSFFEARPRVIRMDSPIFPSLLGRRQRNVREAIKLELTRTRSNNTVFRMEG